MPTAAPAVEVLVIGAGLGGLAMAARLADAGRRDFAIVEADAGVGGTWWANRYPGAACDIPSVLYSLSFAPKADWSRDYPHQAELAAYAKDIARRWQLDRHLHLSTRVVCLDWLPDAQRWHVRARTASGEAREWLARVVVSAHGALSQSRWPDIPGLADFKGPRCHTAAWDAAIGTRAGERVAVIGTGASSVQLVPALAARGVQVLLFQRSPPWVLPKHDAPIGALRQRLRARVPGWLRAERELSYWAHEARAPAFTRFPLLLRAMEAVARWHLRRQVPDAAQRAAMTPRYRLGCKRITLASDYHGAVAGPNVTLITEPITRVEADGVRTADGALHRADALVCATGFDAAHGTLPYVLHGPGGSLSAHWARHGVRAHLGVSVPGFPNCFMLMGPNTSLGHSSALLMIEAQVGHILALLQAMDTRGAAAAEPTADAFNAFNRWLDARLPRTVWGSGCRSWYHQADGHISTLWPASTLAYRWRLARLRPHEYRWVPPVAPTHKA